MDLVEPSLQPPVLQSHESADRQESLGARWAIGKRELTALRRRYKVLSQRNFLHSRERAADGLPDLEWWHPDGRAPNDADWNDHLHTIAVIVRASAETLKDSGAPEVFAVFNAGPARDVVLPRGNWVQVLDSANPEAAEKPAGERVKVAEQSVLLFAHPE